MCKSLARRTCRASDYQLSQQNDLLRRIAAEQHGRGKASLSHDVMSYCCKWGYRPSRFHGPVEAHYRHLPGNVDAAADRFVQHCDRLPIRHRHDRSCIRKLIEDHCSGRRITWSGFDNGDIVDRKADFLETLRKALEPFVIELETCGNKALARTRQVDNRWSEGAPDGQYRKVSMPKRGKVPNDSECAASSIYPDRIDVWPCVAFKDDKGHSSTLCSRGNQVDIDAVAQDKAIHQRIPDGRSSGLVCAIDQAQGGSRFIARKRSAEHQLASIWASDHVCDGVGTGRHKAYRVESAILQYPPARVRAAITELACCGLDPFTQIGSYDVRVIENVGHGTAGHASDFSNVGKGGLSWSAHPPVMPVFWSAPSFLLTLRQESWILFFWSAPKCENTRCFRISFKMPRIFRPPNIARRTA